MILRERRFVNIFIIFAFVANLTFWLYARDVQSQWANVPPAPEKAKASSLALGDSQLAYRFIGLMLQNLGDTGGRTTQLKEYDYPELGRWLHLADSLDPKSYYIPFLAAYYFGATQEPEQLSTVISFLEDVGQRPGRENWRWLSHAVLLARHGLDDLARAYELAQKLANLEEDGMPGWTRMLPAFVLSEKGDKEMAYEILRSLLLDGAQEMHPNEIRHILSYICDDILTKKEALDDPLCKNDG